MEGVGELVTERGRKEEGTEEGTYMKSYFK